MEPRIIYGHQFRCKRTCTGRQSKEEFYTKGKVYQCDEEDNQYIPDNECIGYKFGFITDNQGNRRHAWPYDPEHNPCCSDCWTDYFEDISCE